MIKTKEKRKIYKICSLIIFFSIIVLSKGCYEIPNTSSDPDSNEKKSNSASSLRPQWFVVANEKMPTALFEIRYYLNDNFMGTKVNGYEKPLCILTKEAVSVLQQVQQEVNQQGYKLKFFDCYRPQKAVQHFILWTRNLNDQKMKEHYYPNEDKSLLIEKGYIADQSSHSRGSTVDLTLARIIDTTELDMGTPYDYFDVLSNTNNPQMTEEQKRNRLLLKTVMEEYGFINYDKEWWHYTLRDEPYPDTYFNFSVK